MADRKKAIARFLAECGWAGADYGLLAADASFRSYHRVEQAGKTAILMDAPPPKEDVRPFETVANLLLEAGFSAPRLYGVDRDRGFLLLEDLGDRTYTRALAGGADEAVLYGLATDLLIELHRKVGSDQLEGSSLPPYDTQCLLDEVSLFVDWTLPAFRGGRLSEAAHEDYLAAWAGVLPLVEAAPTSLVLRDYHVDNLMVLDGRDGVAACGLLDFQDALVGPTSYDVVSLLEDARRDISADVAETMMARYLAAFPELDRAAFARAYAILGAQRAAKVIGIFTRLCWRDGKPHYLKHIPRVWRHLNANLAKPELAPVRAWFACHVRESEKQIPPEGRAA